MAQANEAARPGRRRLTRPRGLSHLARGARPVEAVLLSRAGVVLACVALILLLSVNALVFFRTTQTLLAQDRALAHTQDVLAAINASLDTLTTAESAQRGYILY